MLNLIKECLVKLLKRVSRKRRSKIDNRSNYRTNSLRRKLYLINLKSSLISLLFAVKTKYTLNFYLGIYWLLFINMQISRIYSTRLLDLVRKEEFICPKST